MKTLFLDIDGVLNHRVDAEVDHTMLLQVHNQMRRFRRDDVYLRLKWLQPTAVARVNQILDATGAQLIISSTWRKLNTQEELQILLGVRGLSHQIMGMTPVLPPKHFMEQVPRGEEIGAWLADHPEVTSFAILDDDWVDPYKAQHVWVHPHQALTDENVAKAIALLTA